VDSAPPNACHAQPKAGRVAGAPYAATRRPPPAARALRPMLPLSIPAAGDLARLRPRRVQAATDQLAHRRRAAAARPVDGRTAARIQPHGRRAPPAR
jgi:hypothetical protein